MICNSIHRQPHMTRIDAVLFACIVLAQCAIGADDTKQTDDELGPRYYLYQDDFGKDFHPSGWMPDGRGLSLDARCADAPKAGQHCVRFVYRPAENAWVGIALQLDGVWEPARKFNLAAELQTRQGERVVLRFWARSKDLAHVRFLTGAGKGDSIPKPLATKPEWVQLGHDWARYEIDLTGADLSGVVHAFAFFLDHAQGPAANQDTVQWDIDEIYFVRLGTREPPKPAALPAGFAASRERFHRKLATLTWINYSPSSFDPASNRPVSADDIRADLRALAENGFPPANTGISTYGCAPKFGGDAIPAIARELGFGGMILGVWSIDETSEELPVAKRLAAEGLIDAICMGNEGLFFSRYSAARLQSAVRDMRTSTGLPVSTSEVIDSYGNTLLTDEKEMDWVYPNVHPVFHNIAEPRKAAEWVHEIIGKLAARTRLPILVRETGWPSQGLKQHTADKQREFWEAILESRYRFAIFEAFDQPWKHEKYQGVDIGTSWGWFTNDRQPKAVVGLTKERGTIPHHGDNRKRGAF